LSTVCPPGVRAAAEKWSRGKVVRRRLGSAFGSRRVYATPEASLAWWLPWSGSNLDGDLVAFCREFVRPGSVVWDLGGNVGLFSFLAAYDAGPDGRVITLEPDPFLSHLIIRTESDRPAECAPCSVVTAAVGAHSGFATIEVPERSRASNAVLGKSNSSQRGAVRFRFDVAMVTVDALAEQYPVPEVVKIDVEGSELDALRGGERTFRGCAPVMFMEVQSNQAEEIGRLLRSWDYALYDPCVPPASRRELSKLTYNTLAVPRSKLSS